MSNLHGAVHAQPFLPYASPIYSSPGGSHLDLPLSSGSIVGDRKASTVALPSGLNLGGRNAIQKFMPGMTPQHPGAFFTPPMPMNQYAFPPGAPIAAARNFITSPDYVFPGGNAAPRHLPQGTMDASGALQTGLGLSLDGLSLNISQEELAEAAACHGGRWPDRSQLSPEALGQQPRRPLPPIVNTGNHGQMKPQLGDWVCGTCRFTNWRRRRICRKCFPCLESNSDHQENERAAARRSPNMGFAPFLGSPVHFNNGAPTFLGSPPLYVPNCDNTAWMMQVTASLQAQQFMHGQPTYSIPAHAPYFLPSSRSGSFSHFTSSGSPASSASTASPSSTIATSVANSPLDHPKDLPSVSEEEDEHVADEDESETGSEVRGRLRSIAGTDEEEDEDEGEIATAILLPLQGLTLEMPTAAKLNPSLSAVAAASTERPTSAMGHLAHTVHSPPSPKSPLAKGGSSSSRSSSCSPPRSRCATVPADAVWSATTCGPIDYVTAST